MQIDYTIQMWREGSQFVAHAMPLDVASAGSSPEAARAAVHEAVRLFLETAREQGTLGEVLEDAGYERHGSEWRSPAWVGVERHSAALAA
jgi:predicted RNase H-like HicB family nuclease